MVAASACRFYVVTDRVPATTTGLLRQASLQRGVEYVEVNAGNFEPAALARPVPGDLLYRAATSPMAELVERYLHMPAVTTFRTSEAAHSADAWQELTLARGGVPVLESVPLRGTNRGLRRRVVASIGGLPVVVKVPGGEGGVGVMPAGDWPTLHSLLDHLAASRQVAHVQHFVDGAVHWRCIVVGTEVVAAYPNDPIPDDFRTSAPTEAEAFSSEAPTAVSKAAIAAAAVLGTEFAGVDLLVDGDGSGGGEVAVLESNTPCFFAPAQHIGGIDVAGAMIEHLQRKSQRSNPPAAHAP